MRSFISSAAHVSTSALSSVLVSHAAVLPVEMQSCEELGAPTFTSESVCESRPHLIKKFVVEVHGVAVPALAPREVEHCLGCPAHEGGMVAPIMNEIPAQPVELPAEFAWNNVAQPAQQIQFVMERLPPQSDYTLVEKVVQPANQFIGDRFNQPGFVVADKPLQPEFSVDRFVTSVLAKTPEQFPTFRPAPGAAGQFFYSGVEQPSFVAQLAPQVARSVAVNVPASGFNQITATPYLNTAQVGFQHGFVPRTTHQNVMDRLRMLLGNNTYRPDGSVEARPATFREYIEANFTSPSLIEEREFIVENLAALKSQFIRDVQPNVRNIPDVASLLNDETFYQWMLGAQITPAIKQKIDAAAQLNHNAMLNQVADIFMSRPRQNVGPADIVDEDADDLSDDGDYAYDNDLDADDLESDLGDEPTIADALTAEFESRLLSDSPTI